jgi:phage shock protein PspC (stress-responsive transcriptional regulator)
MSGMGNALVRPRNGKMIGGVCAALGRRFGLSTGLVRALFVVSILLPGPQILLYLGLWIFIPGE